jgi:tight adherence protein B
MNEWMTEAEILRWVPMASIFALTLSLWLGLMLWWSMRRVGRRKRIDHRLGLIGDSAVEQAQALKLWADGEDASGRALERTGAGGIRRRLQLLVERIGWTGPASSLVLTVMGTSILAAVALMLATQEVLAGVAGGAAALVGWWAYAGHRIKQHDALFQSQFLDALELLARSLRAGHPVVGAFQLAADEMDAPLSRVFGEVCQQQALGLNIDEALRRTAGVQASEDFRFFTAAICIAMHSGGNLAEMIDRLSHVIRERIRLGRRVRVLTSQAQFSKRVLLFLPVALAGILFLMHPHYMEPLKTTGLGNMLLAGGILSMLLGAWAMNRMARLRY